MNTDTTTATLRTADKASAATGHNVTVERIILRTSYPKNGNLANPTHTYRYIVKVDGERVGQVIRLTEVAEFAQDFINLDLAAR